MAVPLEKAVVARLNRHATHYEVLVEPDLAQALVDRLRKSERPTAQEFRDVCAVDTVFTHWSDGKKASREELLKGFGTDEFVRVVERILLDGELQLTAEQRKRMGEAKHKRVVETILRNAWNPQTKTPHPRERIERALEEAKFRIDPLKRVEDQVQDAMKKLRPLLPIAFDRIKVAVKVPANHTGHAYGVLKHLGDVKKEEWQDDGSLIAVLEIPAGTQAEVYDRLNSLTQGEVTTKMLGSAGT
ncbi:MAG TPA: ribosome assembly factor SBDS [Candidatus Thermoplasmatota archaeon]|nr:ribosome assembly factor SBDS [Candidatus Thermoplasmatota archaeon]